MFQHGRRSGGWHGRDITSDLVLELFRIHPTLNLLHFLPLSKRIALLFAGQGSQTVGMGKDLTECYPSARALFAQADEILGYSLSRIAFEGPEEELTKTVNCQPALYVHGLACLAALVEEVPGFSFHAAAGLSLGEFTAHAAAGTFSFETGLRLVAQRAQFMQSACEETEGGMAALIGADENAARDLAAETDVDVANINNPGQVVISGETSKVALAVSLASEHGIRKAVLLKVAGAYHSRLMQSAYIKLGQVLETTPLQTPQKTVVCNVDARAVRESAQIRDALREQVTGTVRWAESMEYLVDSENCAHFIELGPGAALAGMLQRTRKGILVASCGGVESLRSGIAKLELSTR